MKTIRKLARFCLLTIMLMWMIIPSVSVLPVHAATGAIDADDHFTIVENSGALTTMDAGGSLTFKIQAFDDAAQTTGQDYAGGNFAEIFIVDPSTFGPHPNADVTAVNNMVVTAHGSLSNHGGFDSLISNADISGNNDNVIRVNIADGDGAANTVTVTATSSFEIFVGRPPSAPGDEPVINDGGGTYPGQDFQSITVAAGSGSADHLTATAAVTTAEVNESFDVTISQRNDGGGADTEIRADVGVVLSVDGGGTAVITHVDLNGDGDFLDENEDIVDAASIENQTLVSGALTIKVMATAAGGGTLTITPDSAGLDLVDGNDDEADTVSIAAATNMTIQGYGPPGGQSGVPTMAPVDFMLSKDPSENLTFPLANTADTDFSITAAGLPVTGDWHSFADTWGADTRYIVTFMPQDANGMGMPFSDSTAYTASVKKTFASATDLPGGMPALTDTGTTYAFTFTTGTGGGEFSGGEFDDDGAGFGGQMGGEFPPIAWMGYPQPGQRDLPTNLGCVVVDFDRPMDTSTLTTSNIYLKKITQVGGVDTESPTLPAGAHTVTVIGDDNDSVCISGYTLEASSEYRVVVSRSVLSSSGDQLAGMPVDDNGNPMNGFGFGFGNMGPFKEPFFTGSGGVVNVTASSTGFNLNEYKQADGSITGVPTGYIIRANFDNPLNPSTVNSTNITLKKNGSMPVAGSVYYHAQDNAIEFRPDAVLSASTSYTFAASTSVTSTSGQAITAVSQTFTTGVADTTEPQLVFADADDFGIFMQFDEPLDESTAENRSYYTLKTCSQAVIAADGNSCTGGGAVTTVSLISGVTAHYERNENSVWMDGLTLTAGDGFYVGIASGVTDVAGNGVHAANNKSWTGNVMSAGNFEGGQGMFNMDGMGFEDFDMGKMGENPIGAFPMNTMAGATTKYFFNIPLETQIPAGGYVVFTYPTGFDVSGAVQDADSPMNWDFNGPEFGNTVTFYDNDNNDLPANFAEGATDNDAVGIIDSARKISVMLDAATGGVGASDFLHIDLDGITNSSEPKGFETSGYQVDIKTYNASGVLLEAMTTMPFFISSAGTNTVSGQITSGGGLNGVKVFLDSPMTGPMEVLTSNDGAGTLVAGANDGEYKFENLPDGNYMIFTEPMFTVGANDYYGQEWPEPITVNGAETKNFAVSQATAANGATQPVTITFGDLSGVANLGFNDSIDIFAGGPNGFVVKTVTRAQLGASPYNTTLYLPGVGEWFIGMGPAMPKGPMSQMPNIDWMPSQPTNVTVVSDNIGDPPAVALDAATMSITVSDRTVTGKVVDASGTAISNAEVYAYSPQGGTDAHSQAGADGTFTLNVVEGSYKVGAFLPGMPGSQETSVLVNGDGFYVGGSPTASTGSAGANPFTLAIAKSSITIQGRVSDGTNALTSAAVFAHRTDAPAPPIHTMVDSSGNYTLYVTAGTWRVEADAPNYGYIGSADVVVTTESITGQNFEVASSGRGSIAGTIDIPGTADDSGVMVWAYGANGAVEAKTDTSGNYEMPSIPNGDYTVEAFIPGTGDLAPLSVTVDGAEAGHDFVVATPRAVTVTLQDDEAADVVVSEDTYVDLLGTNGRGNAVLIPAGSSSATINIPDGTFYIDPAIPGVNPDDITIAGAEFNNVDGVPTTDNTVDFDGTGDAIVITLPDLYTITGQVSSGGSGVNDAWVSIANTTTRDFFGTMTSNDAASGGEDGEYSISVPAGTYTLSSDKPGYSSAPVEVTVSANTTQNFTLTANDKTITGTITNDDGDPISNAFVHAEGAGGAFAGTETGADGTYTLSVRSTNWTVKAVAEGYAEASPIDVDTTTASQTGKNFTLTALTGADLLQDPRIESITPSSGGTVNDTATGTEIVIPPLALGSGNDAGQMTTKETNNVSPTPTADPVGNGQVISASDADGNPITILDDDVEFTLRLTLAELATDDIDTDDEVDQVTNAYWDNSTNNWVSLSTTTAYYTDADVVIPDATVAAADTLSDANVSYIELTSATDHFTTFAPVVATGDTPPDAPSGLAASAGNTQVTLTWNANSEGDMFSYNIWEANVTEGVISTLAHSSCSDGSCTKTVTGLTNGTAYSFQILAVDADGDQSTATAAVESTPVATAVATSSGGGGGLSSSSRASNKAIEDNNNDEDKGDKKEEDETEVSESATTEVSRKEVPFTDISTHWAKEFIEDLYTRKIVSGYDKTHYGPNKKVTRAEFTKIALEAFDVELLKISEFSKMTFKDIKTTDWYAPYVETAYANEIISGYKNGTFKANQPISRSEAVKVLLDTANIEVATEYDAEFSDVNADEWYAMYINYAAEHEIVKGYKNKSFGVHNNLTRAEVAKIVSLLLDMEVEDEVDDDLIGMLLDFIL